MPYAQRNQAGEIISLTAQPTSEHDAFLMPSDPEVMLFLAHSDKGGAESEEKNLELLAEDLRMIRILEDLIDLLTAKGVILFSELPAAVQDKILRKKVKREKLSSHNDILVNDDKLL